MLFQRFFFILSFLFLIIGNSKCQLYNSSEVVVFNESSFRDLFQSDPKDNWFIQFYHSLCGHCRHFSILFKIFLKEANYWNYAMKIGVFDCNVEIEFCQTQKLAGFPSFKVYSSNEFKLVEPDRLNLSTLSKSFIGYIKKYNSDFTQKYLKPLDGKPVKPYILLESQSELNLERAFLTYSRRLTHNLYYKPNDQLSRVKMTVEDLNQNTVMDLNSSSLQTIYSHLDQYLNKSSQITKPTKLYSTFSTTVRHKSLNKPSKIPYYLKSNSIPAVYSQDIYSSVWKALKDEVYNDKIRNSTKAKIVVEFLDKLVKYSHLDPIILKGFTKLKTALQTYMASGSLKDIDWKTLLAYSKLPPIKPSWISCNSSLPNLRRYPCGLWTTFHTLTVNLYLQDKVKKLDDAREPYKLMLSIRDFIVEFFSCRECATNFNRETTNFAENTETSADTMIYLWSVHNSVNQRLSNEIIKDPEYPKIRFPPVQFCRNCWIQSNSVSTPAWHNTEMINKDSVISYLVNHYSDTNRIGTSFTIEQLGKIIPKNRSLEQLPKQLTQKQNDSNYAFLSNMDLSLCLFVSIASSILVVALFVKFLLSSRILQRIFCPQLYHYQSVKSRGLNMV